MIYLKNNTEIQAIYIPRQTVLGGGYIPNTKAYEKGYNDGLKDGKTEGIDEQKSKLESINITENGVYSKEDGYNHIEVNVPDLNGDYNEGYEQGQADISAKARVLEVTENGTYVSKFSDPIIPANVTGVYADGTDFYSYALISNTIYSTGIIPNQNTRLEFWFKPYGTEYEVWEIIIGSQRADDSSDTFQVRRFFANKNDFVAEIGTSEVSFTMSENEWHHIIMSVADGFVLDGTKIGDFSENMTDSNTPLQIGGSINFNGLRTEEGYYGMIKIDDNIIIPTENGFKNVTTNQILQTLKDGTYTFTENLPTYGEGELYKTINVNVPDLNGSYDEGYAEGEQAGYNSGYDQGQADVAANARVLEVTKNGTYLSKFSDPFIPTDITGVYADGTEFRNYAELEGISYDSGFVVSEDMKVEIWWKGDVSITDKNLFGSQVNNNDAIFKIRIPFTAYRFDGEIAMEAVTYLNAESDRWYHFKMSYADGFWVDDVKIGDFLRNISGTPDELYINSNTPYSFNGANGYFGMIKITTNGVENIIIPTAEGLKNITTNEMLQVVQNGTYTFAKNAPIYGEGELYKTINVNVPDLNGSYDVGKRDGINEQKSKLTTLKANVNGTFISQDGYNEVIVNVPDLNGSYDEGYEQGHADGYNEGYSEGEVIGADVAANAKVLNVTENGVYKTKFSDPIMPTLVTGVYADGTEFYDYAELKGKVFNTNIPATMNSRIEFWYKGDNTKSGDAFNVIIGANYKGGSIVVEVIYELVSNSDVMGRIGSASINTNWDENKWHHIILSVADGFIVDGIKIGDMQSASYTSNGNFFINGNNYNNERNANGCFGMIKIDDVVIIPTANGFKNVNTGELLEVVKNGAYTFRKNPPTYGEGEIYKTINVNVPTAQEQSFNYDITAFTYKVYDWTSVNINRDNITNDCGDRPLDCLLFRNRSGECTVMTKLDTCSGVVRLENGWSGDSIILSLKSNTITNFSSNSINSNQLTSIDTGFAKLEGNAITNCNALTDIKVTVLNDNLSTQFATNCFNGLPAVGTITIGKNVDVTITDDEITSFFRTIVGEGWTITIKQ